MASADASDTNGQDWRDALVAGLRNAPNWKSLNPVRSDRLVVTRCERQGGVFSIAITIAGHAGSLRETPAEYACQARVQESHHTGKFVLFELTAPLASLGLPDIELTGLLHVASGKLHRLHVGDGGRLPLFFQPDEPGKWQQRMAKAAGARSRRPSQTDHGDYAFKSPMKVPASVFSPAFWRGFL